MKTMHKKGYTLAEALIALGVIGVLAALMLPMINKIKPDTTKISYLRVYDAINEAVDIMINNQMVYPLVNDDETREYYKYLKYDNYPLYNSVAAKNTALGIDFKEGDEKFCQVLASSFGVSDDKMSCSNKDLNGSSSSFTLKDGKEFIVQTEIGAPSKGALEWYGMYKSSVLLDIDGLNNGKNTSGIDRFIFVIYADGRVISGEDKGREYLSKRIDVRKSNTSVVNYTAAEVDDDNFKNFKLEYVEGGEPGS